MFSTEKSNLVFVFMTSQIIFLFFKLPIKLLLIVISDNNIHSFNNHVQLTNWNDVLQENSVNDAYKLFSDKFINLYNRCFPLKSKSINVSSKRIPHKPWITNAILKSIRRKNHLYHKFKSDPTESNKRSLAHYRNTLTHLIRDSKKRYYSELLEGNKNNIKRTWSLLNNIMGRKRNQNMSDYFNINGNLISDPKSVADGFNDYFTNIGPNLSSKISTTDVPFDHFLNNIRSPEHSLFLTPTDEIEVIKILAALRSSASPGPDDMTSGLVLSRTSST